MRVHGTIARANWRGNSPTMKVLAVIPAFNEEECLLDTVCELAQTCPDVDYLVINDGSKDGTKDVICRHGLHAVNLPVNTGLTSAFKTGMKYAKTCGYDAVVQFDADGQHLPSYIPIMAEQMERESADLVIASRFLDGTVKPTGARGYGSRLITFLIKLTTGKLVTDPTSGMRMYSARLIDMFASGFDVAPEPDMVALVARKYGTVVEIQSTMRERQGGESYLKLGNIIRYMSRTCLAIIMLRFLR